MAFELSWTEFWVWRNCRAYLCWIWTVVDTVIRNQYLQGYPLFELFFLVYFRLTTKWWYHKKRKERSAPCCLAFCLRATFHPMRELESVGRHHLRVIRRSVIWDSVLWSHALARSDTLGMHSVENCIIVAVPGVNTLRSIWECLLSGPYGRGRFWNFVV